MIFEMPLKIFIIAPDDGEIRAVRKLKGNVCTRPYKSGWHLKSPPHRRSLLTNFHHQNAKPSIIIATPPFLYQKKLLHKGWELEELQVLLILKEQEKLYSQGGSPSPCQFLPFLRERWPEAKNNSIAMSSDSSSSGNTGHQAGLRRPEHSYPPRVPPHPIPPRTVKPLYSPAWLLADPPHTTPPYSPTPLGVIQRGSGEVSHNYAATSPRPFFLLDCLSGPAGFCVTVRAFRSFLDGSSLENG